MEGVHAVRLPPRESAHGPGRPFPTRSATARAAAEAVVLSLPTEAFQRWIGDHIPAREYFAHFLSHASLQHFLKRFTALGALNASELSELVDALTVESFPAGASVVGE